MASTEIRGRIVGRLMPLIVAGASILVTVLTASTADAAAVTTAFSRAILGELAASDISGDGNVVVSLAPNEVSLLVYNVRTQRRITIRDASYYPSLTRDGSKVIFTRGVMAGRPSIAIRSLGSGHEEHINGWEARGISATGRYVGATDARGRKAAIIDTRTRRVRRIPLVSGGLIRHIQITPNGQTAAIFVANPNRGDTVQYFRAATGITRAFPANNLNTGQPALSDDASVLLLVATDRRSNSTDLDGGILPPNSLGPTVFRPLSSDPPRLIADFQHTFRVGVRRPAAALTADGRIAAVICGRTIYVVDLNTMRFSRVATQAENITFLRISASGNRIAFFTLGSRAGAGYDEVHLISTADAQPLPARPSDCAPD